MMTVSIYRIIRLFHNFHYADHYKKKKKQQKPIIQNILTMKNIVLKIITKQKQKKYNITIPEKRQERNFFCFC